MIVIFDPERTCPGEGEPVRNGNPYLRALASPGALRFSAAGFLGRLQISMSGLGTVLLISSVSGHYGLAGAVAAAGATGYALVSPLAARLADRAGQRAVLRPLMLVFACASAALIAGAQARAPAWVLLTASALAGAATPQLGSMVRARWSALLAGSPLLHTAFSLESVADEVIFVAGPVVVTLLATEVYPASGIAVAAVTCLAGTLLFAAQRATEPPLQPARPAGPLPGEGHRAGGRSLPARGLVTLAPVFGFFGAMLAAIDLATVDFAAGHGHKPLAGVILGGYALGSMAGGLWYGARAWRASLRRRFAVIVCAMAAGTATFWAMPGLAALSAVMLVSGLVLSPMLICGFSLIEQQARPGRLTEGMAWLTSALAAGTAARVGRCRAGDRRRRRPLGVRLGRRLRRRLRPGLPDRTRLAHRAQFAALPSYPSRGLAVNCRAHRTALRFIRNFNDTRVTRRNAGR
jgi:MFS family permease